LILGFPSPREAAFTTAIETSLPVVGLSLLHPSPVASQQGVVEPSHHNRVLTLENGRLLNI